MRRRILGKPGRPWSGAWFALLACGLFAPEAARAGCGAHAPVGAHLSDGASPFDPLILESPTARDAARAPFVPTDQPRPCTGAMCSGKSGIPTPPIPTISHLVEDWAWLDPGLAAAASESAADPRAEAALRPTHSNPAVFHPPRPSHPSARPRLVPTTL